MVSETIKLPFIDLSELKQGSPKWESVKKQVHGALQEYGCFEASLGEISTNLRKSLFDGLEQLFDLPLENKLKNSYDKSYHGYRGYTGQDQENIPPYESFGIDDALTKGKIESFTNLLWSDKGNSTFSETVKYLSEQLDEADRVVRRMVLDSLGLEKYMDEHMNSTTSLVRFQKYIGSQSHGAKLVLPSHTDKSIITILYQNEVCGLQNLTKDGEWINIQPSPTTFVVMVGDSFHAWTNGRLHSPHHRVMMTGDIARYSIGLFSVPKVGYIIKAPEEIVDEENHLLYKPFTYDDYMEFFFSEVGKKSSAPWKAYCGA